MELQASTHPEDAFIAEFTARVAAAHASRAERKLAGVLAAELLDLNPELAYPWGTIDGDVLQRAPLAFAQRDGVAPARVAQLQRVLWRWLAQTGRIERPARLMCRNVRATATRERVLAA